MKVNSQARSAFCYLRPMANLTLKVSGVILGPPSEMHYDDLKDAIPRRSQPGKARRVTYRDLGFLGKNTSHVSIPLPHSQNGTMAKDAC